MNSFQKFLPWRCLLGHCKLSAFLLFFLLFSVCLPAQNKKQENAIRSIRVGCEIDYPPYCYVNKNGEADGFSVDLFNAAAREMGLNVEFVTGPWNKLKYDLASGKLDALPLVGRTPEREDLYDFTFPYLTMHGTIVVREDNRDIHSIDDLTGKKVAVMKGDNAEEFLRRIDLDATIVQRTTFKRALIELSNGQHDAVVLQRIVALHLMKENGLTNLKLVGDSRNIFDQSFCFAVKEGDDELQSLLNEGLSIVNTSGKFRQLHAEWFAPIEAITIPNRRIIVGGDFNYPPFEFLDENGNPAGYNVDLVKAIADEMGMNIEITLGPWSKIRKQLETGHIDAIQGILYSPERDKVFDFSPAHTNISYVIVARENHDIPANLKALEGSSVIVQDGDIMHDHVKKYHFTDSVIPVESQEEALRQLAEGKYDFALASKIVTHYYMDKHGWDNLVMSNKPVLSAEYNLGVLQGNTELLSKLTEGLSAIKSKGIYREIYSEWLGVYEEDGVEFKEVLKYLLFVLIPILVVMAIILLWWFTLKKEVKKKTFELQNENAARKKAEHQIKKLYQRLKKRNEEIAAQNEEYQSLNEELEEKNQSLLKVNEALRVAKEQAQESDKLKSAFLANISHEIRTPMNGIMGFTELLKKPQLEGEKKEEYIDLIQNSGNRMLEIINNLLDLARIEAGQIELQITETCVNEVLFEAVSLMHQPALEKGLTIEVSKGLSDDESRILTDTTMLHQIVINLVNNAIKYTEEGKIEVGYDKTNDYLKFYVRDTGIGISGDMQKKIFERFRQADDTITRQYEGAGLGLSISEAYVKELGGNIWLESEPGEGTVFYFTLPYKRPGAVEPEKVPEVPKEEKLPAGLTILVVEDDEISFLLLKETLGQDVKYLHAENGLEAIDKVKSHPEIDVILMDIKMPDMDGYEATKEIKKINPRIPVIVQTAFAAVHDKEKAFQSGGDEFLSKPVDPGSLVKTIKKFTILFS